MLLASAGTNQQINFCKNFYDPLGIIRQRSREAGNLQRLNVRTYNTKKHNYKDQSWIQFCQWFVGVIDGDGTFTIDRQNNGKKWGLVLKLSQKFTNARLLYYIKER